MLFTLMMLLVLAAGAKHSFSDDKKKGYDSYGKSHYEMMQMLKQTMEIVRDMNHKPSDTDKKALSKMISRLDNMMKDK
ncbi:MAG: hypothetical protein GWN86_09665, partial [Desulfobacterales bacterium]|nr:hypothetical protein [Desulfobacterales bacterium]